MSTLSDSQQRPVVETASGAVRGVAAAAGAFAFRGIPFAAAPVGDLRFAAPQPHSGWPGIRDAAAPGPAAPQWPSRLEAVAGSRVPNWAEDNCLTLNVWTPDAAPDASRPVLLWFHGGGFTSGSGGWDWYDGARLAALGGIVVVTANYRLGPLGYLYLPEIGADNLGSRDQAAALRWVADTIAAFGGDPARITVGGQSAGAFSAMALATDPATAPLVRRVIGQSGPWGLSSPTPAEAAPTVAAYLEILGIAANSDVAKRLRELPVSRLLAANARLAAATARPGSVAPTLYPVLGGAGHPEPFRDAVARGALADKDVLLGTTENEMASFYAFNPMVRTATRAEAVRILDGLTDDAGAERYAKYEAAQPDADPAAVLTTIATDRFSSEPAAEFAALVAAQGNPAHIYRFGRRPVPDPYELGAVHCAELPFLFGTFDAFPNAPMLGTVSAADHALATAFGGALAAFVATGSPNGPGLQTWQPYHSPADVRLFDR
ncbi:carboxylesterase family protein [Nocardia terpenica]|uniref:Carboxylic ester hydrolase n=1 Tax=Nocardia terpenica TaxID=455432 RepID=A0A291RQY3_9NOCA|nr:carboxylesterase family protein [Nocardia terpenica]ATL69658.1 carboxylesterase [Nocardia terpenica]